MVAVAGGHPRQRWLQRQLPRAVPLAADTYRLTFVEKYTGSAAYNRPYHNYSPATADFPSNLWREPVAFDLPSDRGQAIAFSPTAAWLTTPFGVWTASLVVTSLDITAE